MPLAQYIPTVIDKICAEPPPRGIFYLAQCNGALASMGGIRFLREGAAEIKRIYVRPAYRGAKIGEHMLERLLSDAARFGYTSVFLDSGPFMTSAHKLYARCGFVDCLPYPETEVAAEFQTGWRFMCRSLPAKICIDKQ